MTGELTCDPANASGILGVKNICRNITVITERKVS
jgi:hypothetical protein